MRTKQKLLALVLTLAMALSLLPVTALAADPVAYKAYKVTATVTGATSDTTTKKITVSGTVAVTTEDTTVTDLPKANVAATGVSVTLTATGGNLTATGTVDENGAFSAVADATSVTAETDYTVSAVSLTVGTATAEATFAEGTHVIQKDNADITVKYTPAGSGETDTDPEITAVTYDATNKQIKWTFKNGTGTGAVADANQKFTVTITKDETGATPVEVSAEATGSSIALPANTAAGDYTATVTLNGKTTVTKTSDKFTVAAPTDPSKASISEIAYDSATGKLS